MVTPTRQYSAKDLPAHLKLKTRADEQGVKFDKNEFLERERQYLEKKEQDDFKMPKKREIKGISKKAEELRLHAKEYEEQVAQSDTQTPFPQDADYQSESESNSDSSDSDDDASEDDEEEAALLREYVKIKKEREEAQKQKEAEKAKEIEEKEKEELMNDNPLFNKDQDEDEAVYSLGRKWYDETVFKNQARIQKKEKKRFINDIVRSDFQRSFLNRFIQ